MTSYGNPTILLINERVTDSLPAKNRLEEIGCHVCEADSVFEAVEILTDFTSDFRPSLVLMDSTPDAAQDFQSRLFLNQYCETPILDLANREDKSFESLKPVIAKLLTASYAKAAKF